MATKGTLPPVFRATRPRLVRHGLLPQAVVCMTAKSYDAWTVTLREAVTSGEAEQFPLLRTPYRTWWFETPRVGLLVSASSLSYSDEVLTYDVQLYHKYLGYVGAVPMNADDSELPEHPDERTRIALRKACNMAATLMVYIAVKTMEPSGIPTNTRTRIEASPSRVYTQCRDTVTYARLSDLRSLSQADEQRGYSAPAPGASGIRKREHEVRGHWRTYKSGVRVWVKNHTRGDAALGRVTRVLTI